MLDGSRAPSVTAVAGTNDAELRVDVDDRVVRTICAIDNSEKAPPDKRCTTNIMLRLPRGDADFTLAPSSPELIVACAAGWGRPGGSACGVHAGIKPRKRDLAMIAFDAPQVCASVDHDERNQGRAGHRKRRASRELGRCARWSVTRAARTRAPVNAVNATRVRPHGRPRRCSVSSDAGRGRIDRSNRHSTADGSRATGLERAVAQLETGGKAAFDAAEAIMTTDRVPKLAAYAF